MYNCFLSYEITFNFSKGQLGTAPAHYYCKYTRHGVGRGFHCAQSLPKIFTYTERNVKCTPIIMLTSTGNQWVIRYRYEARTHALCPLVLSCRVCGVCIQQESEKGSRNAAQPLLAVGRSPERFFASVHREEPRTLMGVRPGPRGYGSRAGLPAYSRHGA